MMRILSPQEFRTQRGRENSRLREAEAIVAPILEDVRLSGDEALRKYAARFDGFTGESFLVTKQALSDARDSLDPELRRALEVAIENVRTFAEAQAPRPFEMEMSPGRLVGQVIRPLDTVAAYVPGGRYPLPSSVVMSCVPARVAGVRQRWVTTPKPDATVLASAAMAGASEVALLGGAHAIAAFAFGTQSIPKADRIVGPGNVYVTAAKKLLAGQVGIDFVAGPTEVVVIAEEGNPAWIAADLLAQAEHDTDASAVLITTSRLLAQQVAEQVVLQLETLSTSDVARIAIQAQGAAVVCESIQEALDLSNELAPEHLCLHDPALLKEVRHAGSVFLGPYSPEAAGDYVTGPNHVLPTSGRARQRGGLSVMDFVKVMTTQRLTSTALEELAPHAARLARAEGLEAHARSVEVRARG